MERRSLERARHESFLVIRTAPNDMGVRPLSGPFVSPDVTVGSDARPRVVVWNLGTRDVAHVVTEFAAVPAGQAVTPENAKLIGMGNLANIPANSCVTVTCTSIWLRTNPADVLLVTACHPEQDPVKAACDPLNDRHVGQMNYPWAGGYEGKCDGPMAARAGVQIRPANRGLYRVRVFTAAQGTRMPSNPQIDRTMAPLGASFRWQEVYPGRKELWELRMLDNNRMSLTARLRPPEGPGLGTEELRGIIVRD